MKQRESHERKQMKLIRMSRGGRGYILLQGSEEASEKR
jgi:hypothetical protein